ncbi:MAG: hypothetical protein HYX35_03535 [Proteobacteria bacterium]|nr:hypothetical protein [Pseudomonadota bacterium]
MNFSKTISTFGILTVFIIGSYIIANTGTFATASRSPAMQPSRSAQELFYPEIVTPSESEGLTPKEKVKLQLEEGDVMDQVPGF